MGDRAFVKNVNKAQYRQYALDESLPMIWVPFLGYVATEDLILTGTVHSKSLN
jgi:hypothetical protein